MSEVNQDLSIQDLRAIIHGLRMTNFAFVDQDAKDQIMMKIQSLPNPEMLGKISEYPKDFKQVVNEVGEIMKLVEIYSKRDGEYRARFKSKKKLPPRYKVLEWKKNKMETSNTVKTLVKFSSKMDEMGIESLAEKTLVCAKKIQDLTLTQADVDDFIKEAGEDGEKAANPMWSGMKGMLSGAWGEYNVGNLAQQLKNIVTKLDAIKINLKKREPRIKKEEQKERLKKIEEQLGYMIEIGKANYTNLDEVDKKTATPQQPSSNVTQPLPQPSNGTNSQSGSEWNMTQAIGEFYKLDAFTKNEILNQLKLRMANSKFSIYRISAAAMPLPKEWQDFVNRLNRDPNEKKLFQEQIVASPVEQKPFNGKLKPIENKPVPKPVEKHTPINRKPIGNVDIYNRNKSLAKTPEPKFKENEIVLWDKQDNDGNIKTLKGKFLQIIDNKTSYVIPDGGSRIRILTEKLRPNQETAHQTQPAQPAPVQPVQQTQYETAPVTASVVWRRIL